MLAIIAMSTGTGESRALYVLPLCPCADKTAAITHAVAHAAFRFRIVTPPL
jgi:hypothetical protein